VRLPSILDRSASRLPRRVRLTLDWVITIAVAVAFILAFEAEVAKPYRIPSSSMEPTLHCARPATGCRARLADRVIANRLAYRFHAPRRGDVVVFHSPPNAALLCGQGGDYVKRIVGLPGEVIRIRDGVVYVNGSRLAEPYLGASARDSGLDEWLVPRGKYFVLGDNRAASCDSRVWGAVPREDLIGPVLVTYWPPTRLG
jgi:signal peptidase I